MKFLILKPYDQVLNITNKGNLKLYIDGCTGLKKDLKFDGKRTKFKKIVELISKKLAKRRVKECIVVAIEWFNTGVIPELSTQNRFVDLFIDQGATKQQISDHCKLVWSVEDFTRTERSKLTVTAPNPTDIDQLNTIRNQVKLQDNMLGAMIWDSLTVSYQFVITGDEDQYRQDYNCDGFKLWNYIRTAINLATTTGASGYKDEIE